MVWEEVLMFGPVDYRKEVAVTYSEPSPKLRMSILAYMLDGRSLPVAINDDGTQFPLVRGLTVDEYIEAAQKFADWVIENTEEYVELLEALDDEVETPMLVQKGPDPNEDPGDSHGGAYL